MLRYIVFQSQKSDKTPSIIYSDPESLIKETDGCKNSFHKLSSAKAGEHILCGYSISTKWSFEGIKNKHV